MNCTIVKDNVVFPFIYLQTKLNRKILRLTTSLVLSYFISLKPSFFLFWELKSSNFEIYFQ